MTDPLEALEELRQETVPPAIVLAAVRQFRYRALAVVAATVAGICLLLLLSLLVGLRGSGGTGFAVERDPDARHILFDTRQSVDGVEIAMTEIIWSVDDGAARVVMTADVTPDFPEVAVELTTIVLNDRVEIPLTDSVVLDQRRSTQAVWVEIPGPHPQPDTVELQAFVLPVPRQIVEEGGTLTSADGSTITITAGGNPQ